MTERILQQIERCSDPKLLRQWASNAAKQGATEIELAARRRLYAVMPSAQPGTLEFDVWQSIYALEDALTSERGKTTRLSRTRQKIGRDGEQRTVADLVMGKPSEGFRMLIDRGLPELTFEALAIKHEKVFGSLIAATARERLAEAGVGQEFLAGLQSQESR